MRPREQRDSGGADLFRARLDQIIDLNHELAKLARAIDWRFLEEKFGAVYTDRPGRPPLPTRLMAGLAILKHTFDLSDEVVCARWVENPYYQYFCGEEFFRHALPFDRSSITRWRNRMGEERLEALLQESLAVATRTGAMKPSDLNRVIVDTTVQPKNITFPTDAKLVNRAREKLVNLADRLGVKLRQSYKRVGKFPLIMHQRYAHARPGLAFLVSGSIRVVVLCPLDWRGDEPGSVATGPQDEEVSGCVEPLGGWRAVDDGGGRVAGDVGAAIPALSGALRG